MRYILIVLTICLVGCPDPGIRRGQSLFAGCPNGVDDSATLAGNGLFVCKGERDPAPFNGNGRACGDCHIPGDNFSLQPSRVATLPADHPLIAVTNLGDEPTNNGLIRVITETSGMMNTLADGGAINELRQTPQLVSFSVKCDRHGNCEPLGIFADRTNDPCSFFQGAVANHSAKTPIRVPGQDFIPLTAQECDDLFVYLRSNLVSGQDER